MEGQPAAYFDLHMQSGVPLTQVHDMIREVVSRLGRSQCGAINITAPCEHGRYLIMFYSGSTADVFERLYRKTGHNPRRSTRVPDGVTVIETRALVMGSIVLDPGALLRRMNARNN